MTAFVSHGVKSWSELHLTVWVCISGLSAAKRTLLFLRLSGAPMTTAGEAMPKKTQGRKLDLLVHIHL